MTYEMLTLEVVPGAVEQVEARLAEAREKQKDSSALAASWHTEIGPLNQIVQIWRNEALKPPADRLVRAVLVDTLRLTPFSPEPAAGRMGPIFEMRTYALPAGGLKLAFDNWERALPARLALSPLWGIFHSERDGVERLVHVWPYASLNQRMELRAAATSRGIWPPRAVALKDGREALSYVAQETKILLPSSFSPLQ